MSVSEGVLSIDGVLWVAIIAFGAAGLLSLLRWYQGGRAGMADPAIRAAAAYCVATIDARRHLCGDPAKELRALDAWLDAYSAMGRLDEPQRQRATAALQTMGKFPTGAPAEIMARAESLFGDAAGEAVQKA